MIAVFFLVSPPHVNAQGTVIAYVAITLTNHQNTATPSPLEQKIVFTPSTYASFEGSTLGNIRFCADTACATEYNAWLESCTSSCGTTATSATAWVKLTNSIPASGGTLTIYMVFMTASTTFDGNTWGEAPNLSSTYGQYDNGAKVFTVYDNFQGTSLATSWTSVTSSGSVSVNNGISFAVTSSSGYSFVWWKTLQAQPKVAEAWIISVSSSSNDAVLGVSTASTTNNGVELYNGASIDQLGTTLYLAANSASAEGLVSTNTVSAITSGIWQLVWNATAKWSWSTATNSGSSSSCPGGVTCPGITSNAIYVGQSNSASSGSVTMRWARMRADPPDNVMPSTSLGPVWIPITISSTPVTGSGYVQIDGAGVTTPYSIWLAVGSVHTLAASSPVSCGTDCQYEWNSWSDSGAQSHSITVSTSTVTYTAAFKKEWSFTVSYSTPGGGSPTAPSLGYTRNGAIHSAPLTGTPTAYWVDDGTTWSVTPNPLTGSGSSERWQSSQTLSGTMSASSTIVFMFYNQYLQTLSYTAVEGGTGYSAPTYTANQFGSPFGQPLTNSATGYWFDNGASWTITNPLGGSTGSEQWVTSQYTSGTISSTQTIAFSYQNQYYLTMQAGVGGSITPASAWENSGTNVTITATPSGGYTFASWTCTGTGCYSGTANPSWAVTNAAITETGNFNPIPLTIRVDNRTLATTTGGANMTSPQTASPTVEYWYGAGAYDSRSSTDIQSITFDLYRTGHAAGTFAASFVYSFRWVANGWGGTPTCSASPGCWQELQAAGWAATGFNYLVASDSSVTTISGSVPSAKWQFAIKLDQLAVYTTNGAGLWNFRATVVSESYSNPSGARAGTFDVNLFVSVTVPGNMNWGTVAPGSLNVTASGMPVYTTYTANAIVTITIYGGGDPTSQYGDSFPLSSVYVDKTSGPGNNDGVLLSTSPTTLYGNLPVAANSNLAMYWFISTPNPFTPGTYTFTYYEAIQLQSMQQ